MEPNRESICTAELIVENGRLAGTRRALPTPLAVVGRAHGCDIRLNVDGVEPLHCVLVPTTDSVILRDLGTSDGTLVNNEPVAFTHLNDGDLLSVGPFRFRLAVSPAVDPRQSLLPELEAIEKEKESLRIQAAAVAAQQAALTEVEAQLDQRCQALDRQEEQLSHHLDEKRQRLVELQEQTRLSREELKKEQTEFVEQKQKAEQDLEQIRQEAVNAGRELEKQRKRLLTFRDRMKRRYERHVSRERNELRKREVEITAANHLLEKEKAKLEQSRETLAQHRLQFNGERELGRRALQDGWEQLHSERKTRQEKLGEQMAELSRKIRSLRDKEEALVRRETELVEQHRHWTNLRATLQMEVDGLEQRIRNARRKVSDLDHELARVVPQPKAGETVPIAVAVDGQNSRSTLATSALTEVETLTAELVDQRRLLVEQCERFVAIQEEWRKGHDEVIREAESLQRQLSQREQALEAREDSIEASEELLRRRRAEALQAQQRMEGCLARLAIREAGWDNERSVLLGDIQSREELIGRREEFLLALRDRWKQRRRAEMKQIRADKELSRSLRQRYVTLWEECFRRRTALDQEQRSLAEQRLAQEQLRLELLSQTQDSAAADRRLERIRQRVAESLQSTERTMLRERQAIEVEAAQTTEVAERLHQRLLDLTQREEALSERATAWDKEQALTEVARMKLQQELKTLQAHREHSERHALRLRDELESVARVLIDGDEPVERPIPLALAA
jgi:hypothetical protein